MEDPALAFILDEALALLDDGEEPESIIERFPDFSAKLLPLLRVAHTLKETADDAIEVPLEALKEIGEFVSDKIEDLTD
jgi:ABC-type molybdenum transport system ATPase subunit/photorepair protein PhrA